MTGAQSDILERQNISGEYSYPPILIKGMMKIENEILEFIHRRFPIDSHFLDGNCFYFGMILKARYPQSSIWYDVVLGHFVTLIDGKYCDWTGIVEPDGYLVEWDKFDDYDSLQKQRIIKDCIM